MKKWFVPILLVLSLVFAMPAFAYVQQGTEVTVDLKNLDDTTRNKVVAVLKEQAEQAGKQKVAGVNIGDIDPTKLKAWVLAVSEGIKDVCHNLNVEVNEFIKTPAGMIVAGSIVYKLIGKDIFVMVKDIVFAIAGWILFTIIGYFLMRKFIFARKLKRVKTYTDDDKRDVKEVSYELVEPYDFAKNENKGIVGGLIAAGYCIVCIVTLILVI